MIGIIISKTQTTLIKNSSDLAKKMNRRKKGNLRRSKKRKKNPLTTGPYNNKNVVSDQNVIMIRSFGDLEAINNNGVDKKAIRHIRSHGTIKIEIRVKMKPGQEGVHQKEAVEMIIKNYMSALEVIRNSSVRRRNSWRQSSAWMLFGI